MITLSKVRPVERLVMTQSTGNSKLRFKVIDDLQEMRDYLEANGMNAPKSMNKNLLSKLYDELKEYRENGKLPDSLYEDAKISELDKEAAEIAAQPSIEEIFAKPALGS